MKFFKPYDGPDLRVLKREATSWESRDSYYLSKGKPVYEPQRRNWWGNWVRIHNLHNANHKGLLHSFEEAERVVNHFALYGNGHEVVATYQRKNLRTILHLGS